MSAAAHSYVITPPPQAAIAIAAWGGGVMT